MRRKRQGLEKYPKYNYRSTYKDYCKEVKDPLTYKQYTNVMLKFFKKLSRAIIVEKYEWKLPYGLGYLRIGKTKHGTFHWKWDTNNPYTRLKRKRLWSFKPVTDWQTKEIGERGLMLHIWTTNNDKTVPNYDVNIIRHFINKGPKEII